MTLDAKIPAGPIAEKWDRHKFEMKLVNPANKRKFTILVVGSGHDAPPRPGARERRNRSRSAADTSSCLAACSRPFSTISDHPA